jgi:fructose-1,6-bisphosphatase/inositol monophosphatase family enzyme
MDSISRSWLEILRETADAVRERTGRLLPERVSVPHAMFKERLDRSAHEAILETLQRRAVSVRLVSEEGEATFGAGEVTLTADPVDGTTNLARGLPPAVVSLSAARGEHQSGVFAGVVSDLFSGTTCWAGTEGGAYRDGLPVRVAPPVSYRDGLVSLEVSKLEDLSPVTSLITGARHIRAAGCAASSLCRVAEGVLDAHVDERGSIRATDVSAGLFILGQAGGTWAVDGQPAGDFSLRRETRFRLTAASCPDLLEEIAARRRRRAAS